MDDYDEDLNQNPFFKALTTKGKQIYQQATDERRTICIPRKGTTSRSHYNKEHFESNILKPQSDGNDVFITYNNKEVKVNGKFIVTTKGFNELKSVQILFEETFFNRNEESYHVLCIDQPLIGTALSSSSSEPVIKNLETLDNCIDFLWSGHGNRKTRQQINEIIHLFNSTYTRLANETIRHTLDAANAIFSRAMQLCLKESHLRKPALANKLFMDNLKVAVETYVMDGVYEKIFRGISSFLSDEDAALNKTTRNLADLQLKDLSVNNALSKNIPKAKKILSKINKFHTPLEKFYVLKLTIMAISEAPKYAKEANPITADDLLPALVFLIVKTDVPNWLANLTYLKNFHFSRSKSDEFQFYLSTTEAAIEHVRNGRLDSLISMTHNQRLKMASSLFQRIDSIEKTVGPPVVEVFFEKIRKNNTEVVLGMLQKSARKMKDISELLCHPLCSCDKCEKLMSSKRSDPSAVTVFSRDELGCTCLHQAAEFGSEKCIYELIKKGAVVNATNYLGSTPLHYACQRGHHKVVMLLTHYGADPNAVDNSGNSSLHFAIENCHEVVADYLCSDECEKSCQRKLEIDSMNEHGDTPLHIASRWGFGRLVYLLLKCGASKEIKNKKEEAPIDCAMNIKIREIFLRDTNDESKEDGYIYLPPSPSLKRKMSAESALKTGMIPPDSPTTSRRKKEVTMLLKAAANGDTDLVRSKLGLPQSNDNGVESPEEFSQGDIAAQLCHPLCLCEKCCELQKKSVNESVTLSANMCNSDGVSALHVASLHGNENVVKLLLSKANADSNVKTKSNYRTPLHLACQYNNVEVVSILLKGGARTNLKDSGGNTALHFACSNGHLGPAILLLQSGADVNCANHRGNTPLHDAARWNFTDICGLLLHYHAPLDVQNKMSMTPFQYSTGEEVKDLLQEAIDRINQNQKDIEQKHTMKKPYFSVNFTDDTESPLFVAGKQNIKTTQLVSKGKKQNQVSRKVIETRNTVNDLFAALEHENILMLRQIANGIKNFDRRKSLKKTSTIDKSSLWLDTQVKTMLSIQSFHHTSLRSPVSSTQPSECGSLSSQTSFEEDKVSKEENISSLKNILHCDTQENTLPRKSLASRSNSGDDVECVDNLEESTQTDLPESPKISCNIELLKELDEDDEGECSHFEDWFEQDIHSDSADEEFEENIVIVDPKSPEQIDGVTTCFREGHHDDLIPELLSEAMHDTDDGLSRPRFNSRNSVEEILRHDDHLFQIQPGTGS